MKVAVIGMPSDFRPRSVASLLRGLPGSFTLDVSRPASMWLRPLQEADAVVAFVGPSLDVVAAIGYAMGVGKRSVLITSRESPCPRLLDSVPRVDSESAHLAARVATLLDVDNRSARLAVQERLHGTELLEWVGKDPDRLHLLSAAQFEEVVSGLLAHAGFVARSRAADYVIADSFGGRRVLVQCKRLGTSQRIQLEDVREAAESAQVSGCAFVVLASNVPLTQAASAYASTSVPAVWTFDEQQMVRLIAAGVRRRGEPEYITSAHEHSDQRESFYRHLLYGRAGMSRDSDGSTRAPWWVATRSDRAGAQRHVPSVVLWLGGTRGEGPLWRGFETCVQTLSKLGSRVRHNGPESLQGDRCGDLYAASAAMRESEIVVFVGTWDVREESEYVSYLKGVAGIYAGYLGDTVATFLVGPRDWGARLEFPACFSQSEFLDVEQDGWMSSITRVYRTCAGDVSIAVEEIGRLPTGIKRKRSR